MQKVAEYQSRMRGMGLMTMGYEFTTPLLQDLGLYDKETEAEIWEPSKDEDCAGWIVNSSRTICARKDMVDIFLPAAARKNGCGSSGRSLVEDHQARRWSISRTRERLS